MEIQLTTSTMELPVVRDGKTVGTLRFDPQDIAFADAFYALLQTMEIERAALAKQLETAEDAEARIALLHDFCKSLREGIDDVFGKGTARMAFGDAYVPGVLVQFFEGVAGAVQAARSDLLKPYLQEEA